MMINICRMLVVLAVLTASAAVPAAKLYKWIDAQGRVSYHDMPPPEGAGYRVEEKRVSSGSPRAADTSAQDNAASRAPVVLYTASRCEACDLARGYLGRRKVAFTEKNVESNVALQDELKAKSGGLHVPTILVGDKVMRGYLESLLEGELDEAGYPKMSAAGPEETTATERGGLAPTR